MIKSFTKDGIRETPITLSDEDCKKLGSLWRSFIAKIDPYDSNSKGKGIVTCAGGEKYVIPVFVLITRLRHHGCTLPIEVWYSTGELTQKLISDLTEMNVTCRNLTDIGFTNLPGYATKPLCIMKSSFEEVLFLDADNNCLRNPEHLFELTEYKSTGAMFWPDFWITCEKNPIWKIVEKLPNSCQEFDSGQILINKKKSWEPLNLTVYFNLMYKVYYKFLLGDKDTFRFAWYALNYSFSLLEGSPAVCGSQTDGKFRGTTILQSSPIGEWLFMHRNLAKWSDPRFQSLSWKIIKRFITNNGVRTFEFDYYEGSKIYIDLTGNVEIIMPSDAILNEEISCLNIVRRFRCSTSYKDFLSKKLE